MTLTEFVQSAAQSGARYELIDGSVWVSPAANFAHDWLINWLADVLRGYCQHHPEVANYVTRGARLFAEREADTCPEPDLAVFRNVPSQPLVAEVRWQTLEPLVVVEVISPDQAEKDTVRNVELYLDVPTVQEYWIVDPQITPAQPTLRVRRRLNRRRWRAEIVIPHGGTYAAPTLPGLTLTFNP
jgi:Uma2 family endonuclease